MEGSIIIVAPDDITQKDLDRFRAFMMMQTDTVETLGEHPNQNAFSNRHFSNAQRGVSVLVAISNFTEEDMDRWRIFKEASRK